MHDPEPAAKWGWVDSLLLFAALAAGAWLWADCAGASEVAGDSFVALDCGRRFLANGWAEPSQNIFGWGLCATFAPLFVGAESIAEVASRRAFVASLVVPCAFLSVRLVLPAATSLSRGAVRAGSLCAAVAILTSPGVGIPSSSGGHGYLSWSWIAVAVAAFAVAVREPTRPGLLDRASRIVAAAVGIAGVAMAPMNHPFAAWIGAAALVLLPLALARAGILAVLAGVGTGWTLARPRIDVLRAKAASGDTFESFAHQPGSERLLDPANALAWLRDGPDGVLLLGFAALVVLALPLARGDRKRLAIAGSWALAGVVGVLALVLLGRRVGYLQPYHLLTAQPFAALGIGMAIAGLLDLAARVRLPPRARGVAGVVLVGALAAGIVDASGLDEEERPWRTPWCSLHPRDSGTADGVDTIARAILDDLAAGAPERFLLTDLNLTQRRVDGSVALGLSLTMSGVPAENMACCREPDEAPAWYMISDLYDGRLDWNAILRTEGIDLILRRNRTSELVFAVRTPDALESLGEQLCEAIPPDHIVAVHYYEEVMNVVLADRSGLLPAPSPTPPCLERSQ